MALDLDTLAEFGANILYCLQQHTTETWTLWSLETGRRASIFAEVVEITIEKQYTYSDIRNALQKEIVEKIELRKYLEQQFQLAPIIAVLSRKLLADKARDRPQTAGQDPTVAELRQLVEDSKTLGPENQRRLLETILYLRQEMAVDVALAFEEALPFPWAFVREVEAIKRSRRLRGVELSEAGEVQMLGLAFSGGGIRSATFNLGVLQALARLNLIRYFDYLSTVSGGGYIGGWLHAWIQRENEPGKVEKVVESLSPRESPDPESSATWPIKWLRSYSNYLAPRLGLFSADTWSIVTIWARNTLLNLIILILALSALLLIPRGLLGVFDLVTSGHWVVPVMLAFLGFGVFTIQQNLHSFAHQGRRDENILFQPKYIQLFVALPIFVSAILVAAWLATANDATTGGPWLAQVDRMAPFIGSWLATLTPYVQIDAFVGVVFFVLLCVVSFGGDYYEHFDAAWPYTLSPPLKRILFGVAVVLVNAISAALGGCLLWAARHLFEPSDAASRWHQLAWGTVGVVMVYTLVIILHLGLFGRELPDDRREWWSRAGAILSIWLVAWVVIAGIAIDGPWLVALLAHAAYGKLIASGMGLGWIGATATGVLSGRSKDTGSTGGDPTKELLARIAPPIFVAGLLVLLAFGIHMVTVQYVHGMFGSMNCNDGCGFPGFAALAAFHYDLMQAWGWQYAWLWCAICAAAALLLAWRVDVNEFSMHNFYENRLVRCYLGASRLKRQPNRFTGFDPDDELKLTELSPPEEGQKEGYAGPYPIVNAALNLVGGEELAWQERKAESFVFTPLFSGFAATPTEEGVGKRKRDGNISLHGYRQTKDYAFANGGIQLGNAIAISGAAASPNMGYHTSAAAAFLLAVFNVRLGRWMGNPRRRDGWRRSGPLVGLGYLLNELAASTNNRSKYVYLSDAGHFENLGIYELVRRRCRFIVACDGGADPAFTFADLGNAIRKCRSDFGVEIEIDLSSMRPVPSDPPSTRALSSAHCAVGLIRYTNQQPGMLIYLKTSLTGNEPADVLEYARLHPGFPHQPTSDQFFDESQFESYRRLGCHVGLSVFKDIVDRRTETAKRDGLRETGPLDFDRDGFFTDLRQRWQASSPKVAKSFTRHAGVLLELMHRLRNDSKLEFLDAQISPEWQRLLAGATGWAPPMGLGLPESYEERRAGFHFCNSLMQLMEDVYLDLNLEQESDHPDNTGWMNLFRHWTWSAMFRATWMISASCYGARFRGFCEYKLELDPKSIGEINISPADGPTDERLNFREKDLVDKGDFLWSEQQLYLLQVFVKRPDRPEEFLTKLTAGIAVVWNDGRLAYFRVQDHLRSMGLARRFLDRMVIDEVHPLDRRARWHKLPDLFPETPALEGQKSIERMLDSAYMRKEANPPRVP